MFSIRVQIRDPDQMIDTRDSGLDILWRSTKYLCEMFAHPDPLVTVLYLWAQLRLSTCFGSV